MIADAVFERAARMPSGRLSATAMTAETSTSASVSIAFDH